MLIMFAQFSQYIVGTYIKITSQQYSKKIHLKLFQMLGNIETILRFCKSLQVNTFVVNNSLAKSRSVADRNKTLIFLIIYSSYMLCFNAISKIIHFYFINRIFQIGNLKFILRILSQNLETSCAELLKDPFQDHSFFRYIQMVCHKLLTVNYCYMLMTLG